MQTTIQGQPLTTKLNVSEIFETLENEARESVQNDSFTYAPEKSESTTPNTERLADRINVLTQRYRYHKKQQLLAGEATKRKEEGHCKRIQSEAITIMTRTDFYRKSQMHTLGLTPERILTEIGYSINLNDWIKKELREGSPVWNHLHYLAGWGEKIDYTRLEELNTELSGLRGKAEPLVDAFSHTKKSITRDEHEQTLEELTEVDEQIKKLQKEYDNEMHRLSNLKKIPENFCYSIFAEGDTLEASEERVQRRVWNMSRYYLEMLVTMICRFYNELYRLDIEEMRRIQEKEQDSKRKSDMYAPKKRYTTEEMRELIQIGKADGMKQTEVASQLDCGIATVKRHWN
jgi:hypothetical protein